MKTLAELKAYQAKVRDSVVLPEGTNKVRIVVGMATCGIAAGATPVLKAFEEAVAKNNLSDRVQVVSTGCVGICQYEPVAEVYESGKVRTTYVKLTADKVAQIVEKHLLGGQIVDEFTIGAHQ